MDYCFALTSSAQRSWCEATYVQTGRQWFLDHEDDPQISYQGEWETKVFHDRKTYQPEDDRICVHRHYTPFELSILRDQESKSPVTNELLFHVYVDVEGFDLKDITVQAIRILDMVAVTATQKGKADHYWEYRLPEKYDVNKLRCDLLHDGILLITAQERELCKCSCHCVACSDQEPKQIRKKTCVRSGKHLPITVPRNITIGVTNICLMSYLDDGSVLTPRAQRNTNMTWCKATYVKRGSQIYLNHEDDAAISYQEECEKKVFHVSSTHQPEDEHICIRGQRQSFEPRILPDKESPEAKKSSFELYVGLNGFTEPEDITVQAIRILDMVAVTIKPRIKGKPDIYREFLLPEKYDVNKLCCKFTYDGILLIAEERELCECVCHCVACFSQEPKQIRKKRCVRSRKYLAISEPLNIPVVRDDTGKWVYFEEQENRVRMYR